MNVESTFHTHLKKLEALVLINRSLRTNKQTKALDSEHLCLTITIVRMNLGHLNNQDSLCMLQSMYALRDSTLHVA